MTDYQMFRICYIDEDQTAATDFSGEMDHDFTVSEIVVRDQEPLEALIERIKHEKPHFLMVDYHLSQDISLQYDGDGVIARYRSERKDFPCMLLSSDGKGAVVGSKHIPPEIVRDKSELYNEDSGDKKNTKELIILQIKKTIKEYQDKLQNADERYKVLLDKRDSDEGLSLEEEKEATDLNELIDQSLDASSPLLPIDITNGERLNTLIAKTKTLLDKIEADA